MGQCVSTRKIKTSVEETTFCVGVPEPRSVSQSEESSQVTPLEVSEGAPFQEIKHQVVLTSWGAADIADIHEQVHTPGMTSWAVADLSEVLRVVNKAQQQPRRSPPSPPSQLQIV